MENRINLRTTSFWTKAEKDLPNLAEESDLCRTALNLLHRRSFLGQGAMETIEACVRMFEMHPDPVPGFDQILDYNTNHVPKPVLVHFMHHLRHKLWWADSVIHNQAVQLYWKHQETLAKLHQAALAAPDATLVERARELNTWWQGLSGQMRKRGMRCLMDDLGHSKQELEKLWVDASLETRIRFLDLAKYLMDEQDHLAELAALQQQAQKQQAQTPAKKRSRRNHLRLVPPVAA